MAGITRILVVDDFQPFRAWVLSVLRDKPTLRVVAEACDGARAVQKAQELRPDLILLDIGLPKRNGIEVARQVRDLSPNSKILFLSQETASEVLQEAMDAGAAGYVSKSKAGAELLQAIDGVLIGEQCVGTAPVPTNHRRVTKKA